MWGVIAVLQAQRLTESQRRIGIGRIVVVTAVLAAGVIFFWPVHWDKVAAATARGRDGVGNEGVQFANNRTPRSVDGVTTLN